MRSSDLVLVQGVRDTRQVLSAWNERPLRVVGRWAAGALLVAAGLLVATWGVSLLITPDSTPHVLPGLQRAGTPRDVLAVLGRNSLVLALHGFACVAGFIAGSSLPLEAQRRRGAWRWVHDKAGPLAIAFVSAATLFSLATQAYALGGGASTLAAQLHISPALLLLGLTPHAVPELTALFLPLAAWLGASRRGAWHELLAATFVTVTIAVPVLVLAAVVEVYVSPHLVAALAG